MASEPSTESARNELTQQQALALLVLTAETLDWEIVHLSDAGIVARPGAESRYPGEALIAKFDAGELNLYSSGPAGSADSDGMLREFGDSYLRLRNSTSRETLQAQYDSFGTRLNAAGDRLLHTGPPTARQKAGDFLSMFRPARGYVLTPVLVIANILVFVLMVASGASVVDPVSEFLISWGANFTPATYGGEWWRLLSSTFLHGGIIHLLMNMYALLSIGVMLEPRIGTLRFGAAYLISGIGGSLASLWWHPVVVGVGASGAIFGMYGVFLAMLTTSLIERHLRNGLLSSIGLFVGYNLLFGLQGNIDNAAHIGGLLSGVAVGYAFYPSLRQPGRPALRNLSVGIVLVLASLAGILAARNLNNDFTRYQQSLERFSANEARFQAIMKDPALGDEASYLRAFRQSVPIWEENLRLIQAAGKMDLPEEIRVRNEKLARYAGLRLQELQIALRSADGGPRQDSLQISIHREVSEILEDLNKK